MSEGLKSRGAVHGNHPQAAGPLPRFLIWEAWGGARKSAFLTSSQGILVLLVWGPQFENHSSSSIGELDRAEKWALKAK